MPVPPAWRAVRCEGGTDVECEPESEAVVESKVLDVARDTRHRQRPLQAHRKLSLDTSLNYWQRYGTVSVLMR